MHRQMGKESGRNVSVAKNRHATVTDPRQHRLQGRLLAWALIGSSAVAAANAAQGPAPGPEVHAPSAAVPGAPGRVSAKAGGQQEEQAGAQLQEQAGARLQEQAGAQLQEQAAALEGPAQLADRVAALFLSCGMFPGLADWALASRVRFAYGFLVARAERIEADQPAQAQELRRQAIWRLRAARDAGLRRLPADHPALLATAPPGSAQRPSAAFAHTVYWTAAAWGALLTLDREDLDLLADWPRAQAMANWLLREDPDQGEGAVRVLAAGFELARPDGDPQRARQWLAQALDRFGDRQASLHLAWADWMDLPEARARGEAQALRQRLETALKVARQAPSMENTVAGARAAWLLSRLDELF